MPPGEQAVALAAQRAALPPQVQIEDVPCPMGCPGPDTEIARSWDRLHGVSGTFTVVRCDACGLMRTTPRPTLETIGIYYPQAYSPHLATTAAPRAGLLKRLAIALRLDGTKSLVPPVPAGAALEIGCASGRFMQKLRARGWKVSGIEPSREAAARAAAAGFSVHAGPLETAPAPAEPFDLIVASHTIEHLHDPLGCLRRMRAWSKDGAYLTCEIPDAGGLLFRRFGGAWYDLDLPRHLFHFTRSTLAAMLAKAGWKLVHAHCHRTLNGLAGTLGYSLRDRSEGKSALGNALMRFPDSGSRLKLLSGPLSGLLKAVGQTGRMVVWARAV